LQEELCELEEHVRYLDTEILHRQQRQQHPELRYLDDLYLRRDDTMMTVQSRLKRYTEAISSLRQFEHMSTDVEEKKTKNAVEEHKSWISANYPHSHVNNFNWLDKPDIIDISAGTTHTHNFKNPTHSISFWKSLAHDHLIQSTIFLTVIFVTLLLIPPIF